MGEIKICTMHRIRNVLNHYVHGVVQHLIRLFNIKKNEKEEIRKTERKRNTGGIDRKKITRSFCCE